MENKVLSANIEQIKQYDIELANEILMFDIEKANIQLAQNENGQYNLVFNSIALHSTLDVLEEAKNIVKNIENKQNQNSIRILYGLGLGYLADEFCSSLEGNIVIYEPNIEIIKYVLSVAKIDALFNKNVVLCSKKDVFINHIQNFANDKTEISISFLTSYKNLFFDDIKEILELAQKAQGEFIANKNTLIKKTPKAFCHTLYNLKNIFSNPNISSLKDIYKGKTALILCAGPTLKENIEIIKNNQDKFVTFALNPTLKLLAKHNIKPDFIVNVENSDTSNQFANTDTKEHYLILEGCSNHNVSKLPSRKTFNYLSNDNFFNNWVRDCLKIEDNLESRGTVSYTALMSAYIMGFEKIILVGQDLAYKDGFCYSKECQFGHLECIFDENEQKYKIIVQDFESFTKALVGEKIDPKKAQKIAQKRLNFLNNNLTTVKSQDGKLIPTQTGYALFIKHFEEVAKKLKSENSKIQLFNASSGGAQIDGWENIALEQLISSLESVEKISLDNYSADIDVEYVVKKINELEKKLEEYLIYTKDFVETNEKLLKELTNKNIFTQNAQKLAQKHASILSNIAKLKQTEDINTLVAVHLLMLEKHFKNNYFSDIELTKKALFDFIKLYKMIDIGLNRCLKALSDCKAVISK